MTTRLRSQAALAVAAAVALYVPTLGLPLPDLCTPGIGVAGAAPSPSPSCGGDLRECLRLSADMRQTTFGGRFVTAEDVARCTDIFNSCIHGGAGGAGKQAPPGSPPPQGGNSATPTATTPKSGTQGTPGGGGAAAPPSTSQGSSGEGFMPEKFELSVDNGGATCRRNGNTVNCTGSGTWTGGGTYTSEIAGTLTGRTMKATLTVRGQSPGFCTSQTDSSGPITYDFNPDGTVAIHQGPQQYNVVYSAGCADSPPQSGTSGSWESTGTWSPG
jgi:hypothetical protein